MMISRTKTNVLSKLNTLSVVVYSAWPVESIVGFPIKANDIRIKTNVINDFQFVYFSNNFTPCDFDMYSIS